MTDNQMLVNQFNNGSADALFIIGIVIIAGIIIYNQFKHNKNLQNEEQ